MNTEMYARTKKKTGKKYGYARVSSLIQKIDGHSLEIQERQLKNEGCTKIYKDIHTGMKIERPNLDKLISIMKEGDTIVVTKLDRIARSVVEGVTLIDELIAKGITVHILDMGVMDDTPFSRLTRTILFAIANFERDIIVERTQAGKAYAKANNPNWREGRRPVDPDNKLEVVAKWESGLITATQAAKEMGISRGTLYKMKNEGRLQ